MLLIQQFIIDLDLEYNEMPFYQEEVLYPLIFCILVMDF